MKLKNILFILRKELLGIARDKKVLVTLILLPLLFYPLLISGLNYFQGREEDKLNNFKPSIAYVGKDGSDIESFITKSDKVIMPGAISDPEAKLSKGEIQGILEVDSQTEEKTQYQLLYKYDSTDIKSRKSLEILSSIIDQYKNEFILEKFEELRLDKSFLNPVEIDGRDTASDEKLAGTALIIIPYFMIISILAGAISTGMDLTAGEKERGTIATLLSSQLSKQEIVIGKICVITLAGFFSSILSVIGLIIAIYFSSGDNGPVPISTLPANSIFLMTVILLTTAVFISSIVIGIGFYSKSIKEGSTYTTPLYMIIIFLGVLSTVEGLTITKVLYFIPILNAIFTIKSILFSQIDAQVILITVVSMLIYSAFAVAFSVRLCSREEVLFRS